MKLDASPVCNPQSERSTFSYDVIDRRTLTKLANRVRASMTYDNADRLTILANVKADSSYVSRYDYAYDNTQNKTRVIEANADRVTWSYDPTYQLTRERRSGANSYDVTYIYDVSQNRKAMVDSGARTTYSCDVANQLNWLVDGTGRTTFSYDNNGNQTLQLLPTLTRTTNVWDGENRMTQVLRPSDRSTYTYKCDNLRIMAEEPAAVTSKIIWDGQIYLVETDAANATQAIYSHEPTTYGSVLSQRRSVTSFYHADSPGSVTNLTDNSGTVTDSYLYRALGVKVATNGTTINPFRYLGLLNAYSIVSYNYYVYLSIVYSSLLGYSLNGQAARRYISLIALDDTQPTADKSPIECGPDANAPVPLDIGSPAFNNSVLCKCFLSIGTLLEKDFKCEGPWCFTKNRIYFNKDTLDTVCEDMKNEFSKKKCKCDRLTIAGHGVAGGVGFSETKLACFVNKEGGIIFNGGYEKTLNCFKDLMSASGYLTLGSCQQLRADMNTEYFGKCLKAIAQKIGHRVCACTDCSETSYPYCKTGCTGKYCCANP
ncbi:MAG: hypothetical protein QM703_19235 [Gemmatales bacterium]